MEYLHSNPSNTEIRVVFYTKKESRMENKENKNIEEEVENQISEEELVDFSVTERKYRTRLTRKFENRKFWENPSAYEIHSSIPGTVVKIMVREGRKVYEGTPMLVLEAMKMQNNIEMPFTARIKKIHVKPGMKIPKNFLMVELINPDEE